MQESAFGLEDLTEAQAYELLRTAKVGRVVYTEAALPAITPVNFALEGRSIVFRTAPSSRLAHAVDDAVVAFEVDDVRHEPGPWWSVVVLGVARLATDVSELIRVQRVGLTPWADGDRTCYMRIVPSRVTGRRLTPLRDLAALP